MFPSAERCGAIDALTASIAVLQTDPTQLDAEAIRRTVAIVHCARRVLDGALVHLADQARRLEADGSAAPAEESMLGHGDIPPQTARHHVRRSELADALPLVGAVIRAGRAIPASVDHLGRAWQRLDDTGRAALVQLADHELASLIARVPPDTFAGSVRRLVRSIEPDDGLADHQAQVDASTYRVQRCRNGMRRFIVELDPIRGDEVEADIDAVARAIRQRHADVDLRTATDANLRAEALHALIRGGALHPTAGNPRPTGISLLCDQRTVLDGPHGDSVCETVGGDPVPYGLLQRMACDASVTSLLIGSDARPFDAGRAHRTATARQKQALRALYPTCPLSGTPFRDCEVHHIDFWEHGGPTDLANLIPISRRWHHLIHDRNWRLEIHPDRSLDLFRPDGRHHRHVDPPIPVTRPINHRRPASVPIAA